jgi:peptidoglycan-N-acetylglucosamine deacetylase
MNKKGVLCLTFDNMGHAIEVGQGKRPGPDQDELDLVVGYPRVFSLLEELDVSATFFIEGWNALHHPREVSKIAELGYEVGLHGWVHETFHTLPPIEAERVLIDSLAAFRALNIRPEGFRAPGGLRGESTLALLRKLGIKYDCSAYEGSDSVGPSVLEGDFPSIPFKWPLIDYYQYFMHPDGPQSPLQLESLWADELDAAAARSAIITIIFHPFVSGNDPDKFATMERLLKRAKANSHLEILSAGELAGRLLQNT